MLPEAVAVMLRAVMVVRTLRRGDRRLHVRHPSKAGEVVTPYYEDGSVTIYHGRWEDVLPTLQSFSVGFADPPYNYGLDYGPDHSDDLPAGYYVEWCQRWFDLMHDRCDRLFITPGYGNLGQWIDRGPSGIGAWYKPGNPAGAGIFQFCEWEPICVWGSGRIGGSDVFRATTNIGFGKTGRDGSAHPCPKPLKLMRSLLAAAVGKTSTATVLDPFMGSGTTLRAAKDLGLMAVGIEQNEAYCEIAAKRMAQEVLDFGAAS